MKIKSTLGFEHRRQPLLPRQIYYRRLTYTALIALSIIIGWTFIGMLGYHFLADLSWVDAFLNSAMIVGGMGPIDPLRPTSAKIFAGFFAIFSGVMFLSAFAIMAAPIFHRFLHKFHLEAEARAKSK